MAGKPILRPLFHLHPGALPSLRHWKDHILCLEPSARDAAQVRTGFSSDPFQWKSFDSLCSSRVLLRILHSYFQYARLKIVFCRSWRHDAALMLPCTCMTMTTLCAFSCLAPSFWNISIKSSIGNI